MEKKMHYILLLLAGGVLSVAPATPRRLRVVTVASNLGDPRLVYATSSAQHFGLEITVLGAGRKAWWPEGLGLKINLVREYARSLANDEDVILVIDAYDVVVLADASDILRRFDTFEKGSVIFNGETCVVAAFVFAFGQLLSTAQTITKGSSRTSDLHSRPPPPRFSLSLSLSPPPPSSGCFPSHFAALYPADVVAASPWSHLNSGAYIGTVGAIKRLIPDAVPEVIDGSDQAWFQRKFVGDRSGLVVPRKKGELPLRPGERWHMLVDAKCTIFQNNINLDPPGHMIDWRLSRVKLEEGGIAIGEKKKNALAAEGGERGALRNTVWNTHPVVIHLAGPGHWAGKFGVTAISRVFKVLFPIESAERERRFDCQFIGDACGRHMLVGGTILLFIALAILAIWSWWWRNRLRPYIKVDVVERHDDV